MLLNSSTYCEERLDPAVRSALTKSDYEVDFVMTLSMVLYTLECVQYCSKAQQPVTQAHPILM